MTIKVIRKFLFYASALLVNTKTTYGHSLRVGYRQLQSNKIATSKQDQALGYEVYDRIWC